MLAVAMATTNIASPHEVVAQRRATTAVPPRTTQPMPATPAPPAPIAKPVAQPVGTAAAGTSSAAIGRIRGVVFDSLLMQPVPGASVMLMSSTRSTTTDRNGLFSFDSVSVGAQPVAFSSPELDSLGLGTLGAVVNVTENATASTTLATPSVRTLWSYRCNSANRIGSDSGIVWGSVRDASTDSVAVGGGAAFYWYDLNAGVAAGLRFNQRRRTVATDASGVYFACGLPSDVAVSTEGLGATSASGRVDFTIGPRRLKRVDLLVSPDMVVPEGLSRSATDSALAARARGRATLRGVVHDDKGGGMDNANVLVVGADSGVRTDAQGRFVLSGLPSGTQLLQVRHVGVAPVSQVVQLRPGQTLTIDIAMAKATVTLAASKTVAKSEKRLGYEDRRARKLGYAIDSTLLNHRADLFSAMSNVPLVSYKKSREGAVTAINVRGLSSRGAGEALIYLDGLKTTLEAVMLIPPDHFRAIEFLPYETVPGEYMGKIGQGVVLFWSQNVKW